MSFRRHFVRRRALPGIDELREEWNEEGFRVTASSEPGIIVVAVRDDETETWAEIEIGTGQVDELIRLLRDAHGTAQQRLDAAMLPPDQT